MRFEILATDFDGTLARQAKVEASALDAIERLRASGRRMIMVTGREIEDLKRVFHRLDLFDIVVAENGALLYYPTTNEMDLLAEPPSPEFVKDLRQRGVPVSVGHVIVSSREPHETVILDVIKLRGLELEIIFNKGAVMILPAGVNKATGLTLALHELGVTPAKTVGIGDAENDHAFLNLCGCAVAVANALPSIKEHACYITRASYGAGVVETIERMLSDELAEVATRPAGIRSRDHPRVLPGVRMHTVAPP